MVKICLVLFVLGELRGHSVSEDHLKGKNIFRAKMLNNVLDTLDHDRLITMKARNPNLILKLLETLNAEGTVGVHAHDKW